MVGRRTVGQRIVEHDSVLTVCLCMSRVSRIEGMVRHGANLADVMKCLVDMKPPLQGEVSACSRPSQHQSAHTTLSRSKVMMLCGSLQQQLRQGSSGASGGGVKSNRVDLSRVLDLSPPGRLKS